MCTLNLGAVQQSIAQIKSQISNPPELVYTEAQVNADAQAGKIDVNLIGELFSFLPEENKKEAMKMAMDINRMKRERDNTTAIPFDWDELEAQTGDKEFVSVVKNTYETELKMFQDVAAGVLAQKPEFASQLATQFHAKGGLFDTAAQLESDAAEEQKSLVAQLEELEVQMGSVEDITIAQLLDKDPEMRKQIEAEFEAHNWAP